MVCFILKSHHTDLYMSGSLFGGPLMTDITVPEISVATLAAWLKERDVLLIDVREEEEWEDAHLAAATLAPMSDFDVDALPAPNGRPTVVMCRSGKRSAAIANVLLRHGWTDIHNLTGGILDWQEAGYPVVEEDDADRNAA